MADDKDDKTEEATARKLSDARKRGEIVYSQEAATWIMLAAGAMALSMLGPQMMRAIGNLAIGFFAHASTIPTDGDSLRDLYLGIGLKVGAALGMFFLVLAIAAIAARLVQDVPTWAPEKLKPSLEKLDPIKGLGRILGPAAWGNFAKAALKLGLVGAAGAWALWPRDSSLSTQPLRDLSTFWEMAQQRTMAMLGALIAAFAVIAAADYFFTRQSYMKRMRMSRHEIKEEFRQAEGDPHVLAKLKQIRGERGRRRMMAAVPTATVVVTNPTHYAVALKYEQDKGGAPLCVAKGVDEVALRIREAAAGAEVPIVEDPPLARALYASAEIDEAIPRAHYEAVAKVIGVVMRLAAQKRSRRSPQTTTGQGRVNPNRPT
ncbi:MAG TPA: flagellar type III secretion system protein FlhB [Caulobacterales bacterium]|nr:flagellar type III secretion system protein FlhB [Caulobacterales bacterium]